MCVLTKHFSILMFMNTCDVIKQNRTWEKFLTPPRGWSVLKSGIEISTTALIKQTFTTWVPRGTTWAHPRITTLRYFKTHCPVLAPKKPEIKSVKLVIYKYSYYNANMGFLWDTYLFCSFSIKSTTQRKKGVIRWSFGEQRCPGKVYAFTWK